MDKIIKDLIEECEKGHVVEISEDILLSVFKNNFNIEKETPRIAMNNWLDRTEPMLGIEWVYKANGHSIPNFFFRSVSKRNAGA